MKLSSLVDSIDGRRSCEDCFPQNSAGVRMASVVGFTLVSSALRGICNLPFRWLQVSGQLGSILIFFPLSVAGVRMASVVVVGAKCGQFTIQSIEGSHARCVCSCGVERVVRSAHLRSGHTTSCGCRKAKAHARACKPDKRGVSLRREYSG